MLLYDHLFVHACVHVYVYTHVLLCDGVQVGLEDTCVQSPLSYPLWRSRDSTGAIRLVWQVPFTAELPHWPLFLNILNISPTNGVELLFLNSELSCVCWQLMPLTASVFVGVYSHTEGSSVLWKVWDLIIVQMDFCKPTLAPSTVLHACYWHVIV